MNIKFKEKDIKELIENTTYIYDKIRKELFLITKIDVEMSSKWFFVSVGAEYLLNATVYDSLSELIEDQALDLNSDRVIVEIKSINVEEL